MKLLILVTLLFFAGCSEPDTSPHFTDEGETNVDAGSDAADDVGELDDASGPDTDQEEIGECADDPCDELIDHPQCEAATCDNTLGCSFSNIREALPCEADGIRDGRCEAGECVGTTCTCDEETECCDGCIPVNEDSTCDDDDANTFDDSCAGGECQGTPCECDEGECCDGCQLLPAETVCEILDERETCSAFETCGASRILQEEQRRCSGASDACEAPAEWVTVEVMEDCFGGDFCTRRHGSSQCLPEFGC